jgi:hypothetical protein
MKAASVVSQTELNVLQEYDLIYRCEEVLTVCNFNLLI